MNPKFTALVSQVEGGGRGCLAQGLADTWVVPCAAVLPAGASWVTLWLSEPAPCLLFPGSSFNYCEIKKHSFICLFVL